MPLNSITIIGNLGRDPETKFSGAGKAVTKFSVAVTERWTKDGEKKEHTEWFNVVCFDKIAEVAGEYLTKGREVCVQGKMRTDDYEKDGEKKRWVELVADRVVLLSNGSKKKEGSKKNDENFP